MAGATNVKGGAVRLHFPDGGVRADPEGVGEKEQQSQACFYDKVHGTVMDTNAAVLGRQKAGERKALRPGALLTLAGSRPFFKTSLGAGSVVLMFWMISNGASMPP